MKVLMIKQCQWGWLRPGYILALEGASNSISHAQGLSGPLALCFDWETIVLIDLRVSFTFNTIDRDNIQYQKDISIQTNINIRNREVKKITKKFVVSHSILNLQTHNKIF